MKRIALVTMAATVGALLLVGAWGRADAPRGEPARAGRWEYRILTRAQIQKTVEPPDLTAGLNLLGEAGWELAAVDGLASEPIFEVALREKLDQAQTAQEKAMLGKLPIASTFFFKRLK